DVDALGCDGIDGEEYEARRHGALGRDLGGRVLVQERIDDAVGDLVADLVGVTTRHGLGREDRSSRHDYLRPAVASPRSVLSASRTRSGVTAPAPITATSPAASGVVPSKARSGGATTVAACNNSMPPTPAITAGLSPRRSSPGRCSDLHASAYRS